MLRTYAIRFMIMAILLGTGTAGIVHDALAKEGDNLAQTERMRDVSSLQLERQRPADVEEMWTELGVSTPRRVFRMEDAYNAGKWSNVHGRNGETVSVQQLTDKHRNDWQDLVYIRRQGKLLFAGAWDMPFQLGKKPEHSVVEGGMGMHFLAVRYDYPSTRDCRTIREEAWLSLQEGVPVVIQFPRTAAGCRGPLNESNLEYTLNGIRQWEIAGVHRLELSYSVEHTLAGQAEDEEKTVIFSHVIKLRFIWNNGKYQIDRQNSDGDMNFGESGSLSMDIDILLRRQRVGLMKLASGGDELQADWLMRLLRKQRDAAAAAPIQMELDKRFSKNDE